jgi:hypothetical protein
MRTIREVKTVNLTLPYITIDDGFATLFHCCADKKEKDEIRNTSIEQKNSFMETSI